MKSRDDISNFLEEVKSMLEVNEYHENIVNLQGITYRNTICENTSIGVGFVERFVKNIFLKL